MKEKMSPYAHWSLLLQLAFFLSRPTAANDKILLSGRRAYQEPPHSSWHGKCGGGWGGDAGTIHLRSWTAQKIMALCSRGLPSECGYLSEERLFHSVLLLFPDTSICAFHMARLLNFWSKSLKWPGFKWGRGHDLMVLPCRPQIFTCHCLVAGVGGTSILFWKSISTAPKGDW